RHARRPHPATHRDTATTNRDRHAATPTASYPKSLRAAHLTQQDQRTVDSGSVAQHALRSWPPLRNLLVVHNNHHVLPHYGPAAKGWGEVARQCHYNHLPLGNRAQSSGHRLVVKLQDEVGEAIGPGCRAVGG